MRRITLGALLLLAVTATACGGSGGTGTPTIIGPSGKTPPAVVAPTATAAPASVAADTLPASVTETHGQEGTKLVWHVTVTKTPAAFHVVTAASHADTSDGGATEDRQSPSFRLTGKADYMAGESGETWLTFDLLDFSCGRVQLDASMVYASDQRRLILVFMQRYHQDCDGPPPPQPPGCLEGCDPPPPPCGVPCDRHAGVKWQTDLYCGAVITPFQPLTRANFDYYSSLVLASDGTDDSQEPFGSGFVYKDTCEGAAVTATVNGSTATVTVASPMTLSFVAYRKNGTTVVPQQPEDGTIQTLQPGTHTLTVKVIQ